MKLASPSELFSKLARLVRNLHQRGEAASPGMVMETQKDAKTWLESGLWNLRLKHYCHWPPESDKRLEEAVACFDKATDLKPDCAEAWFYKGLALAESGHHSLAEPAYAEALRLNPDHLEAWRRSEAHSWFESGLASLRSRLADSIGERAKELDEAVDCFDRSTVLRPDYAEAWFYKGAALASCSGGHSLAVEAFEEALRLRPDHLEAWRRLAAECSMSAANCFAEVCREKEPTQSADQLSRSDDEEEGHD